MKAHIGVDAGSGYIHTVTPANAHDITQASELIREDDETILEGAPETDGEHFIVPRII